MDKYLNIILNHSGAKPCEQVLMLKIIMNFGVNPFETTFKTISSRTDVSEHNLHKLMPRLKRLGWMRWTRTYGDGIKNLKFVTGCLYEVTVGEQQPEVPAG
jgi:hypothetical protein